MKKHINAKVLGQTGKCIWVYQTWTASTHNWSDQQSNIVKQTEYGAQLANIGGNWSFNFQQMENTNHLQSKSRPTNR